jgi:hypothetical protein
METVVIETFFNQAVIGSDAGDAEQALIQIRRPDINVVSAYMPLSAGTISYLDALDIEARYLRDSAIHEPAFFSYRDGQLTPDTASMKKYESKDLPRMPGYDSFMEDIGIRAGLFAKATGFDDIGIAIRVLSATKDNLVWHRDNKMDMRGLQTLTGDVSTLWLPDQNVDLNNFSCEYDEQGRCVSNSLSVSTDHVRQYARAIETHHMSIHKGDVHSNPLYHSAPAYNEELGMRPGSRVLMILDKV